MKIEPLIAIEPMAYLLSRVWEPVAVGLVVLMVLVYLMLPAAMYVAKREVSQAQPAATMYIPAVWRDALTQAAVREATPRPRL